MHALAVVLMTVATAGEVSLTVASPLPCLESGHLRQALVARGLVLREVAGPATLVACVSAVDRGVRVEGVRGARRFERVVPVEAQACAAVERVVVALLESWAAPAPRAVAASVTSADAGSEEAAPDAGPWFIAS